MSNAQIVMTEEEIDELVIAEADDLDAWEEPIRVTRMQMLFETDIIDAVCAKLQSENYHIRQKLQPTQRGDDIIAVKKMDLPRKLYIEAKGETSSRKGSNRYGKPFDSQGCSVLS